jgi:hypothetical protein
MSKASRRTGRSLREGLRRDTPAHRDRGRHDVPTQPDPAARLAVVRETAQRKRHKTKTQQPQED